MFVKDSEKITAHAERLKKEMYYEKLRLWERDKVDNAIYVTDNDLSPGNWEKQKGQELTTEKFEQKLLKIFPGARFATFPKNPSKRCVYRILPDGSAEFLCSYENGKMTEHSVLYIKEEDVLDINPTKTDALTHIDRQDLPHAEWDGTQWNFDRSKPLPGSKRVTTATREVSRGWRTVLIKLLQAGVITLQGAEKEFGTVNDRKWAFHTGKQKSLVSPF